MKRSKYETVTPPRRRWTANLSEQVVCFFTAIAMRLLLLSLLALAQGFVPRAMRVPVRGERAAGKITDPKEQLSGEDDVAQFYKSALEKLMIAEHEQTLAAVAYARAETIAQKEARIHELEARIAAAAEARHLLSIIEVQPPAGEADEAPPSASAPEAKRAIRSCTGESSRSWRFAYREQQ